MPRPDTPPTSARARLVGLMSFSLALALAGSVAIVAAVLFNRADARVADELGHEAAKLRAYVETASDPAAGRPYTDVDALLTAYLRTNVPDADEAGACGVDEGAAEHAASVRRAAAHTAVDRGRDMSQPRGPVDLEREARTSVHPRVVGGHQQVFGLGIHRRGTPSRISPVAFGPARLPHRCASVPASHRIPWPHRATGSARLAGGVG